MSGGSSGNIEDTMKPKQTKAALEFTDSWTFEPELLSAAAGCHSGLSKQSTCCMFRTFRSAARL